MKYWDNLLAFLIVFLTPIAPAMIMTGGLIVFDTALGVSAAKKRGETITSRKLSQVLVKMFLYQGLIIISYGSELYMVPEAPLLKVALGAITTVELTSIYENGSAILGKPLWKAIKNWLGRAIVKK